MFDLLPVLFASAVFAGVILALNLAFWAVRSRDLEQRATLGRRLGVLVPEGDLLRAPLPAAPGWLDLGSDLDRGDLPPIPSRGLTGARPRPHPHRGIGAALHCRALVILLGERPGLATPESLGAYFTYDPKPGRTDADRNCISNIHADGQKPAQAAAAIVAMIEAAFRLGKGGVELSVAMSEPGR